VRLQEIKACVLDLRVEGTRGQKNLTGLNDQNQSAKTGKAFCLKKKDTTGIQKKIGKHVPLPGQRGKNQPTDTFRKTAFQKWGLGE
jgi:hypothetical protein